MKKIVLFSICVAWLCCLVSVTPAAEKAARPNIILCMADDQGFGDVGYYGNPIPKTPNLDAMAAESLRLDRFNCAAPVCSPTRGSVLTGRHPNRFACFSWGHTLRPQEVTVAEALKTVGYTTGHFGKWHLGSVRADSPVCPGASGFDRWLSSPNFYENDVLMSSNGRVVQTHGESSQIVVDAALKFIDEAGEKKQPFLAVIWFGNPHSPHQPRPELAALYKDLPKAQQNYYGEISGIDRAMGHLRKQLRERGLTDNTLLWYTSDNGPQGSENRGRGSAGGLRGRKGTLWEGGLRVPTIIEWPARIKKPRTSALVSGTVDIFPTLLELAGVKSDARPLDGVSLVSLIDGHMETRKEGMGFWVYPQRGISTRSHELLEQLQKEQSGDAEPTKPRDADAGNLGKRYSDRELPGSAAWIEGDFKLHLRVARSGSESHYELYNLVNDPAESTDLIVKEPQRAKRMQAALAAWRRSVIGSLNGEDYPAP